VAAGLDAATKIGTGIDDLRDAANQRRLEVIKRQVDQRAMELEFQGINATAESSAELKRLQQQVELANTQGTLAPPTELAQLQNELAEATARRDLDAVTRDRAQAAELADVRAGLSAGHRGRRGFGRLIDPFAGRLGGSLESGPSRAESESAYCPVPEGLEWTASALVDSLHHQVRHQFRLVHCQVDAEVGLE
jgi:hypothetical protein